MSRVPFDVSKFPLVIATFPKDSDIEDCKQYTKDLGNICRNHKNILYMIDARQVGITSAGQDKRKAIAKGFDEITPAFNSAVIARAHLVSGKFMEGVFTAFSWLLPDKLTSPCKVFSDYDEAVAWLMSQKK